MNAELMHYVRRPRYDQSGDGLTHEESVLRQHELLAMIFILRCTQFHAFVSHSKYVHAFGVHGPDMLREYGALGPFGQSGFEGTGKSLNKSMTKTSRESIIQPDPEFDSCNVGADRS